MATFILMHETVKGYDAIGNDIEFMYNIIREKHDCYIYAKHRLNDRLEYIDEDKLDEYLESKETIVIYHHSTYWELGYEKLKSAKGLVIVKYHNITPGAFFEPYNEAYFDQCEKGRELTDTLQKEFPDFVWVSDSEYNSSELNYIKDDRKFICPPFNMIDQWHKAKPDKKILSKLEKSDELNVLFVGRVVPNKGHFMLINILQEYCARYDDKIKLRLVGKFDTAISVYKEIILDLIEKYHLDSKVEFIGEVNDNTLMAYYQGSDVMLCCSEHEGFCVPVIEAQSLGLPVVALRSSAVPDTIGPDQLVFDEDVLEYVAALRYIKEHDVSALQEAGKINYETNYTYNVIREKFIEQIKIITGVEL